MINRIVHPSVSNNGEYIRHIPTQVIDELESKGLAFPDPVHVTYNSGVKKIYKTENGKRVYDKKTGKPIVIDSYPILTTVVEWATGDKTIVTNSKCDGLQLDDNGKPTAFAKECGFAFAVTKKLLTSQYAYDDNGNLIIKQEGFGQKLSDIVSNATDLQELEALKKKQKAEAEKRRHEAEAKHEAKKNSPPRLSLAEAMDKLSVALKEIEELKASKSSSTSKSSPKKTISKKVK